MTWLLGRLTARRWAVALGVSDGGLLVLGLALFGGLAAIGWQVAGRWSAPVAIDAAGPATPAESLLLTVAVCLWALAAAFGIFAAHAAAVPPSLGFLRTLPVTPRQVRRAATLPVALLAFGASAAIGPLAVTVTTASTGHGPVHAITLLSLIIGAGVALGTILHRLSARLLAAPGLGSLRLTTAYLVWCLLVAVSVVAPLPVLQRLSPAVGLAVLAPLGWPLAWWALIDPTPAVFLGALAVTVVTFAVAARLGATGADVGRRRTAVCRLEVARLLPLVRVQARRLIRHPRTLEALVVVAFFGVVLTIVAGWLSRRLPGVLSPSVVALLGAQLAAAPTALARGLSDRRRPVEAALGIGATEHVLTTAAAALGLAVVASLPALGVAVVLLPASVALVWLAALPLLVAVGLVVSWALVPELGNGSAEGGAVLVYAVTSAAVLALAEQLPGPLLAPAPKFTLVALAAAVALEHAHRRPT